MSEPRLGISFDQEVVEARAELIEGRWASAGRILGGCGEWNLRDHLLCAFATWQGRPRWIERWVEAESGAPEPFLISAVHALDWAWQAASENQRQEEVWRLMGERFTLALGHLERTAALDPADPGPWAWRVMALLGLRRDPDEVRRAHDEAVARHRESWTSHLHLMTALTERWGGSHQAMHDFAGQASASAPPGSRLHALVAEAAIDRFLAEAQQDRDRAARWLATAEVADEIEVCHGRRFPGGSGDDPLAVEDHNRFAFLFWQMGRKERAWEELGAVDGRVTKHPWSRLGSPVEQFSRACSACAPHSVQWSPSTAGDWLRHQRAQAEGRISWPKILRNDEPAELAIMVGLAPWAVLSVPVLAQTLEAVGFPLLSEALAALGLPHRAVAPEPTMMAVIALSSALLLIWANSRVGSVRRLLERGTEVVGRIVEVELDRLKGRVEYEYAFGGKRHRGRQSVWRNRTTSTFRPGGELTLVVHPRRPWRALIRALYVTKPRPRKRS